MNEQEIIQDYKNGMTIAEIARKNMETHIRNLSKIRDYYIKKVQKEIHQKSNLLWRVR